MNKGLSSMVSILLEYGADVDAITGMGTTALHLAGSQDDLEIFQLLHQHGADFTALEFSRNAGAIVEVSIADKAQSSVFEYMRVHGL